MSFPFLDYDVSMDQTSQYNQLREIKQKNSLQEFIDSLTNLNPIIVKMLHEIEDLASSLRFEDKPDYEILKNIMKKSLEYIEK